MNDEKVVAEIGPVYTLLWAGTASVASIVNAHGLKVGDKLIPQSAYAELEKHSERMEVAYLASESRAEDAESQLAELRGKCEGLADRLSDRMATRLNQPAKKPVYGAELIDWANELRTLAAADGGSSNG